MNDLSTYSVADLRELENQVAEQIKARTEQERAAARKQILEIAERAGVPLKDLLNVSGAKKARKGTPAPIRFRSPDNQGLQWSGRGRQPQWVKDWVNSGKSLDQPKVS
jgi:DNA-binding protein H-NS